MCLSSVPGHRCPGKLVPEGVLPPPPPPPMLAASFSPAPGHTCAHPGTRGEMWPDPMVPWYQALPQPHYTQFGGRLRKRKLRPGRDVGCPPVPHMEAPLSPACGTRRPALKFPGSGQTGWRSPAAGQCWVLGALGLWGPVRRSTPPGCGLRALAPTLLWGAAGRPRRTEPSATLPVNPALGGHLQGVRIVLSSGRRQVKDEVRLCLRPWIPFL